jgi:hypothetical protein
MFEYNTNKSLPAEFRPPEDGKCVECGGELEKLFSVQGQSFDIVGYCYMNEYGKHAWKKNLSPVDQAKVLSGDKDPY